MSNVRDSPRGPVHIAATSAGSRDGICWWYRPFGGLGLFGGCAGALVPGLTGNTRNPIFASATALSRIVMVVLRFSSRAIGASGKLCGCGATSDATYRAPLEVPSRPKSQDIQGRCDSIPNHVYLFVWLRCKAGWLTKQCQTTAWKASDKAWAAASNKA